MGYTNGWCTDTLGTVLNKSPRYCLFHWWSFLLIIRKTWNFAVTTHYFSLSWGSWIHFTPAHPEIRFNITILPLYLCLKSSKRFLSFRFSHKNLAHISVPSSVCHMPHMYDPPDFIIIIFGDKYRSSVHSSPALLHPQLCHSHFKSTVSARTWRLTFLGEHKKDTGSDLGFPVCSIIFLLLPNFKKWKCFSN